MSSLHTKTGACVDLDRIATLMLQAALEAETKAQTLATLSARIDAPSAQLEEALEATLDQLLAHRFLQPVAPPDWRV